MKRFLLSATLALTLVVSLSGTAGAAPTGVSPAQLTAAGWTCLVPPPHPVVHCLPPGTSFGGPAFSTLVFETTDPIASEAPFLGTELNIRVDLYLRGEQPCPQDPPSREYTDLRPLLGIPYFACHHYNSPL